MVKKTLFKYSSVLMSVVLIASTLTACGTNTVYNQVSSEVAVSSEAASNTESIISNAIKNELLGEADEKGVRKGGLKAIFDQISASNDTPANKAV